MEFMDAKRKIISLLENNGVLLESNNRDVDLREYSVDSITFISFILDVEKEFEIVIPDDFLTIEIFNSLDGFVNLVIELRNECTKVR